MWELRPLLRLRSTPDCWLSVGPFLKRPVMSPIEFEDVLARYRAGERAFIGLTLIHVDAFESDLRGVDFSDSCLDQAYLPYSNLSQAQLMRVSLAGAELGDTKLFGAVLTAANLAGANLSRSDLRHGQLQGANLQAADLSGADLRGANLSGANLQAAKLIKANLVQANLEGADLSGASLFRAEGNWVGQIQWNQATVFPDGHRNHRP